MKKSLPTLSIALILSIGLLQTIVYADFNKGLTAYQNKDYAIALKEFTESASQGDGSAQFGLGFMYANGEGVPKDANEAVKWYRLAADQGYAAAQQNLGNMYFIGKGVVQNDVLAYALLNLAAVQSEGAKENRDLIERHLTPQQLGEAQAISSGWQVGMPFPTTTKF